MARFLLSFDNFSGGEYGLRGGLHAPPNSFTGSNVVLLPDGSICPRSGLVNLGATGTANGAVLGFGYHSAQSRAWYIQGTAIRDLTTGSTGGAVRTMATALASTPTKRVRAANAENDLQTFLTNYGDKCYYIDHSAGTATAIAGSPGGIAIGVYNDRLVVAATSANGNRAYYSAAGDFTSWPVANYLDVGYGYSIILAAAHRDHVTFAKTDGTWWVLTGTPGVNDILRRALRAMRLGDDVAGMTRWGITGDGRVWFLPEWGEYPTSFDGATVSPLEHLAFKANGNDQYDDTGTLPKVGVTGLTQPSDLFCCTGQSNTTADDNQGLLFTRGAWTHHVFTKNISGYVDGRFDTQRRVLICDGGAVGTPPKFYAWSYALNRPPFSGYTWESIGDDSTSVPVAASFTLPEWWAAASRHRGRWDRIDVKAVSAIVDFKKWNHGYSSINNAFTISVTPMRIDGADGTAGGDGTAVTGSWSEAPSSSATTGTLDRQKFTFDPVFANGFRVAMSGLVGVAIQKIHIEIEFLPGQGI